MIEHLIIAAILAGLAAATLLWALWAALGFWRKHLARRRRRNSIVGVGLSVVHRLPSVEERPLNFTEWWENK